MLEESEDEELQGSWSDVDWEKLLACLEVSVTRLPGDRQSCASTTTSSSGGQRVQAMPSLADKVRKLRPEHLQIINVFAANTAFQRFELLFGSWSKKLGNLDSYLQAKETWREGAMRHPKTLSQGAAELLAAQFWAEMVWHSASPMIEPSPASRARIRDEMAQRILRACVATSRAQVEILDCQPLLGSLLWFRECNIAMQMSDAFRSKLEVEVRAELRAGLGKRSFVESDDQVIFRQGSFPVFAWAAKVAFYPFVQALVDRFDKIEFEPGTSATALQPQDVDCYDAWISSLPNHFVAMPKEALAAFCALAAQEVSRALPVESGQSPEALRIARRKLLLSCLQAMFVRAAMALSLQSSIVLQPEKHEMAPLFCAATVSAIFNAAALVAGGADPTGLLLKSFGPDAESKLFKLASASAHLLAVELATLADDAQDSAASTSQSV